MISLRIARSVKPLDWSTSLRRLASPHRLTALAVRNRSFRSANKEEVEPEEDSNDPIKYSTSKAAQFTAAEGHGTVPSKRPKYERGVIVWSVFFFLLYFCVLREENDIDQAIGSTMQESLAASEKKYNAKHST